MRRLSVPIIFLRHGETDWNAEGRLQGQRDIPLNATGRGQAKRNGEAILRAFPDIATFDAVASPLGRTRATMEIARAAMGLEPGTYRTDERLLEITFGDWEGFTLDDLRGASPDMIAARENDKWGFVPPGGESYAGITGRVGAWLAGISRPTFVVSHGGVGRVVRHLLLGIEPALAAGGEPFPQDKALVLREGRGDWL